MNHLPVTDSTISGVYLSTLLRKEYALSSETTCTIFRTGISHSYIVTDKQEKFILRIYSFQWRTELEISEEIRLLNLLKEQNIPISYPICNTNQQYILKLQAPEGLRYAVLFSYAYGEKVRAFTTHTSYTIGKLMAQFHKVTQDVSLQRTIYNVDTLVKSPYLYASKFFPATNEEMKFIKKAGEEISSVFLNADSAKLRKGVIHLDIWYDNMHIKNETEITFFDFDFCGNGWLLHDIAYFIMQMYHQEPDKELYKTKQKAFFSGYESVSDISAEEKMLLPYSGLSIWIFYLGVQAQRFENWSNVFLSKNYLKRFIGMVKDWLNFNGIKIGNG